MPIIVSGASGFLGAAAGVWTPFEGICLFDPRVVPGCKPDSPRPSQLIPIGVAHPGPWATQVSPSGVVFIVPRTTCWSGKILRDDTLKSSTLLGEGVCGGVSLSIISGSRSPEEEDC